MQHKVSQKEIRENTLEEYLSIPGRSAETLVCPTDSFYYELCRRI